MRLLLFMNDRPYTIFNEAKHFTTLIMQYTNKSPKNDRSNRIFSNLIDPYLHPSVQVLNHTVA